jgi:hypothetical protein
MSLAFYIRGRPSFYPISSRHSIPFMLDTDLALLYPLGARSVPTPNKRGGLNGSLQHLLKVFL